MKCLHLRNVPVAVLDRLKRLAEIEGTAVNAVAVRELTLLSRRVENPNLLDTLPDHQIDSSTIVEDLDIQRGE